MPGEPYEAAAVLEEMRDERGFLIWCLLRAVDLVVSTDATQRGDLFSPGAEQNLQSWVGEAADLEESLRQALTLLTRLLGSDPPDLQAVSAACANIAEWASNAGFGRTAFSAAVRAAAASPHQPEYCHVAGIMARRVADYTRAEAWLKRTSAVAQRVGDLAHHGLALMGLATLHIARFEHEAAVSKLKQVLTLARRHALWHLRPQAYHDLFCLSCMDGTPRKAARYALAAARGYGRFHAGVSRLAHDLALFLLLQDRGPTALRVLRSLNCMPLRSAERLIVLSTIGRAAGAAGDERSYFEVWSEFWKRLDGVVEYDRTAEALITLAWGAATLRDATRLDVAAREALRIAAPRGEEHEVLQAEQMLACLSKGDFPKPESRVTGSTGDLRAAITAAELLLRDMLRWPHVITPHTVSNRVADRIATGAAGELRGFRKLARLTRPPAR
jgi:tetratricopeptide (TPR) repeat protein